MTNEEYKEKILNLYIELIERHKDDKEIKVGDEVISADGKKGVVWLIYGNDYHIMGDYNRVRPKEYLKKTGRHFDQIAKVLEQLKGEYNDRLYT